MPNTPINSHPRPPTYERYQDTIRIPAKLALYSIT